MNSKEVLDAYMKAFGKNLQKVRSKEFEQMSDVAKHSAYNKSNYNKFELGKGNPTIESILKIASVLKVDPKELFNFEFDMEKHPIDD